MSFTGTSPINIGLHVKRSKNYALTSDDGGRVTFLAYTIYYSKDGISWFSDQALTTSATLPADAVDVTSADATRYVRNGQPDAGAWEHR